MLISLCTSSQICSFAGERHSHAAVEIHAINTNRRIVLDAQINVFANPETEVASLRKILFSQFVFLDLQTAVQDFLSLGSADGNVDSDLVITTDAKCTDCVAGFACRGKMKGDQYVVSMGSWETSAGSWAIYWLISNVL